MLWLPSLFLSTLPARGATLSVRVEFHNAFEFLSTLPARGATGQSRPGPGQPLISIHAPREGSDVSGNVAVVVGDDFYPRSPRGERRVFTTSFAAPDRFLSTLPARGATKGGPRLYRYRQISIHAPREGSDWQRMKIERRQHISIHAPREGSDRPTAGRTSRATYFYPRSPRGERQILSFA